MPRTSARRLSASEVDFIMNMKNVNYSNREIARRLGITEGAIRYRLKRLKSGLPDKRKEKPSSMDSFKGFLSLWIQEYEDQDKRPTYQLLFQVLCQKFDFHLTYDALRRYVAKHWPDFHQKPVWTRIQTPPGAMAFVDWKEDLKVRMGPQGQWMKVNALVLSLGFSGKIAVVYSTNKDLCSFISGHQQGFRRLGGLVEFVRTDCLKSAVVQWKGRESKLNERYRSYLSRLGMKVFPARPGKATDKGKVEKRIRDFFNAIDFRHQVFSDMKDLQSFSDKLIISLEQGWRSSTTGLSVTESFEYETEHLKALPKVFPVLPIQESYLKVARDCTVHFCKNRYQLEMDYVGKTVLCMNTGTEILIYHEGKRIGQFTYLPVSRGMVMLSQKALSDPRVIVSDQVRKWGLEVARRQVEYYQEIVGGVQ